MKKFELVLTDYEFDGISEVGEESIMKVEIKKELSSLLRLNGIYENGIELCDGVEIARQIKTCENDSLEVSETELNLIKKVIDKLLSGKLPMQRPFGGVRYEHLIERIFKAKEI